MLKKIKQLSTIQYLLLFGESSKRWDLEIVSHMVDLSLSLLGESVNLSSTCAVWTVRKLKVVVVQRFVALFVLWPMLMGGTVTAVWFLVSKEEVVNEKLGVYFALSFLSELLPPSLMDNCCFCQFCSVPLWIVYSLNNFAQRCIQNCTKKGEHYKGCFHG